MSLGERLRDPRTYLVAMTVLIPTVTGLAKLLTGQDVVAGLEQVAGQTSLLGGYTTFLYALGAVASKVGQTTGVKL